MRQSPQTAPLRGRAIELERIAGVLQRVRASGQGELLVILGEPGIGKTALLKAAVGQSLVLGFSMGIGRAHERDQIAPMVPLLEALRSGPSPLLSRPVFTDLAPLYSHQPWLIDGLTTAVEDRAVKSPLLIAIDDVQWADQLSLFALRVIPSRLAGMPIVWVLSSRSRPRTAVSQLIDAVTPDVHVEVIELGPLMPEAVAELARDRLGAPPNDQLCKLLAGAAGSPFLTVELLDGLARGEALGVGELPQSFVASALERLKSLSSVAVQFIRAGSILGGTFRLSDATALMGVTSSTPLLASLEQIIVAGVLEDDGSRLTFRHDLLRQAVYEDIPPSLRRSMHRSVAELMMKDGRGPLDAAPHVLVYATSGDCEAGHILRQAALLIAASMPKAAAEMIERAFTLFEQSDPEWFAVGLDAIRLLTAGRRDPDAIKIADTLLAAHPDDNTVARTEVTVMEPLWAAGNLREILARADSALLLPGLSDELRAQLMALRALGLSCSSNLSEAGENGETALKASTRLGDLKGRTLSLQALGEIARNDGNHAAALDRFQQLRVLRGNQHISEDIMTLQLLDRYEEAATLIAEARGNLQRNGGSIASAMSVAFAQLWQNYSLALLDEANADCWTILRLSEEYEDHSYGLEARLTLASVARMRGDLAAAQEHFLIAAQRTKSRDEARTLMVLVLDAWIKESGGDLKGAVRCVADMMSPKRETRHRWMMQSLWLVTATRIAVRSGELSLARDIAALAEDVRVKNPNVASIVGAALYAQGMSTGDGDALRRAAIVAMRIPRPIVKADIFADYGWSLLRSGQRASGIAAIDDALKIYYGLGAFGDARRAEGMLRKAGIRRSRSVRSSKRPTEGLESLTPMEIRVARLIAEGRTNRAAAAELLLSANTIGTHVRSIFVKLGVRSRVQLARAILKSSESPD